MKFLVSKNISRDLWILSLSFILIGILAIKWHLWFYSEFGLLGCFMLADGLKQISAANPTEVGVLKVWGERQNILLREGYKLLAPYWPLNIDLINVDVTRQNVDFEYSGVTCKEGKDAQGADIPGGEVSLKISATYEPDHRAKNAAERINQYLNSGGKENVEDILEDVIGKAVRNIAGGLTWVEFIFIKAALEATLMMRVADTQFRRLPREHDGSISEEMLTIDPDGYDRLPQKESDPIAYIKEAKDDPVELDRRTKEISVFLKKALINGGGDVMDIGIRITRLNVVKIVPEGSLAKAAEEPAKEDLQRVSEGKDFETERMLAQAYIDEAKKNGDKITYSEALELVRINRQRATETIVRGSGNPLADAAAVLNSKK